MTTYKIVRYYFNDDMYPETIITGLTKKEAQEHCNNPETSSSTATSDIACARTEKYGHWFDGWREE